jgi:hypothetical protein
MTTSGMLSHVALVRTDVSEEHIAFIIRVTRIRDPHDVTSQKTAFVIVTAWATPNLRFSLTFKIQIYWYTDLKKSRTIISNVCSFKIGIKLKFTGSIILNVCLLCELNRLKIQRSLV